MSPVLLGAERPPAQEVTERLPEFVDADALHKYFMLNEADLEQIKTCRGTANKMIFAAQLCTLRWRGHFLRDTSALPEFVTAILAPQLGLLPIPIEDSGQNRKTRFGYLERIRRHLGFVRFGEPQRQRLFDHLIQIAPGGARTPALRQLAGRWLQTQKIVKPGPTTLRDLVNSAREDSLQSIYRGLMDSLPVKERKTVDALLAGPSSSGTSSRTTPRIRSRLEQFKLLPKKESPQALLGLLKRLTEIRSLGLTPWPALAPVHPAMRRLLATWGYSYDVWSLRRFPSAKRYSIVLCFLQAALSETLDSIIEMQDKLITSIHNKARKRRDALLQATEESRTRAVEVLEGVGDLILDSSVPDGDLRNRVFSRWPRAEMHALVSGCRRWRTGEDGSHLGFVSHWYGYSRQYSPELLAMMPFQFSTGSSLGQAVEHLQKVNQDRRRKLPEEVPLDFLPPRWARHVIACENEGALSRPVYELALLTTLNERLKSGDVTVAQSRRWSDFEEYLIPKGTWLLERQRHYAALKLPMDAAVYVDQLNKQLMAVTDRVDKGVPDNPALTIDAAKGKFHLARLKALEKPDQVKILKSLIESRLPRIELVDLLIDIDNQTNFLRHFLHYGSASRLAPAIRRRNVLAGLIAIGCNVGPQHMAAASGISFREITQVIDWYLTEEALKQASTELVNYASHLPLSRVYGQGATCSADGMRFYVPINILSADYSHLLQARGVTLYAHTADNCLQMNQQPIPCRLRESTFVIDGLQEHETELDPKVCYTDTHGFTEVVMATAALLGFELAPHIKNMNEQTLYKIDRAQRYSHLDPILPGTVKTHIIQDAWDETVRVIASIQTHVVSSSLILNRLSSYARQNSVHQALAEIGRACKTMHILRVIDDESYRRRMRRELNKGESSHDLSRFLCFGKEGALRGREFGDQLHTFSCLSVLHNAVVAWNTLHIESVVKQLREEGHTFDDATLALTTPLMRRHINPFGKYHFNVDRMRQTL